MTLLAIAAMIPMFLEVVIVFPVLGHATWHLYKMATVPVADQAASSHTPPV